MATALDQYLDKSTVLKKDNLMAVNESFRWDGKVTGQGPFYGISKDWSQVKLEEAGAQETPAYA